MDGHKTPSKDNKERQHSKVRRNMGPRERDGRGVHGCWLACICREKSACFSAPQYLFHCPLHSIRVGSDLTHGDSSFMMGRLTGRSV